MFDPEIIFFLFMILVVGVNWPLKSASTFNYDALTDDEKVKYHQQRAKDAYYITDASYHNQMAQTIIQRQIRDEQRTHR